MNDLETRLRDHGTAWRAAQPAAPDLDIAGLGAPRPMLRRPIVVAAVAVAAALVIAVLVVPTRHESRRVHAGPGEVVVPWKDDPVPFPPPPSSGRVSALPTCHVDALRASPPADNSSPSWTLTVTNIGTAPCALSASPPVLAGDTPDGSRHQWHTTTSRPADAVDLAPGRSGLLAIGSRACATVASEAVPVHAVTAMLSDGALQLPGVDLRVCPGDVGGDAPSFSADFVDLSPKPPPLAALTARVEGLDLSGLQPGVPVPEPGRTIDYSVVLSNSTAKDIPLEPCPTYTEGIGPGLHAYHLNCDSVTVIPAHGEVRYQMRLRITPADLYMAFSWQLDPGGPSAHG